MSQPEQQPQKQTEVLPVEVSNEEKVMVVARRVIDGAFRSWVENAGLHPSRVQDILNSSEGNPKGLLKGNERNRVVRQADIAIKATYEAIEDLDQAI